MATAAEQRDALVIGIDAYAGSMVEASRRAGRPAKRGGLPNARFVVAAAEALPTVLDGCADALTIHFPWGSLLRGLLEGETGVLSGISRIARPGAVVTVLLSVTEHDRSVTTVTLDQQTFATLAPHYGAHGLRLCDARPATSDDIASAHSSWAKRLLTGTSRPVWLARFDRAGAMPGQVKPGSTGRARGG